MMTRRTALSLFGASGLAIPLLQAVEPGRKGVYPPTEYLGKLATGEALGIQIGPSRPNRAVIHVYSGGLPGMGSDGLWEQVLKGKTPENSNQLSADGGGWTLTGDPESVRGVTHRGVEFSAKPVKRVNAALGAKPPQGAIVLFDGTDTKLWRNASKDAEGHLKVGAETLGKFRDFKLHIEFRLPLMMDQKGQDRANSGVYLQNRYEIQVLDSFALVGTKNECGSIYEFRAPDVNACLPPETWQCYDIEFRAARFENGKKTRAAWIKVIHNGIVVHNGIEVPKQTGYGRPEGPEPGPIQLQNHGSAVVYRNIWLVETPPG